MVVVVTVEAEGEDPNRLGMPGNAWEGESAPQGVTAHAPKTRTALVSVPVLSILILGMVYLPPGHPCTGGYRGAVRV